MSTPIIFLDFDGVLNTYKTWGHFPREQAIDPDKVALVALLAHETGAKIVISSAWRSVHNLQILCEMLLARGGMDPALVISQTPDWKGSHMERGGEISQWIQTHKHEGPYVILDDLHEDAFKGHEGHFTQTNLREGFTEERHEHARNCLERQ